METVCPRRVDLRMKLAWLLTTAWSLWCGCAVAAEAQVVLEDEKDRPEWVLKFRDDFERTELGYDWSSNDATIRPARTCDPARPPSHSSGFDPPRGWSRSSTRRQR